MSNSTGYEPNFSRKLPDPPEDLDAKAKLTWYLKKQEELERSYGPASSSSQAGPTPKRHAGPTPMQDDHPMPAIYDISDQMTPQKARLYWELRDQEEAHARDRQAPRDKTTIPFNRAANLRWPHVGGTSCTRSGNYSVVYSSVAINRAAL